ncbi:DUF1345 domain-containing protein [Paenarthrobacter sp. NPDC089675]|uniref:DUF1345 domain-containing protein n=1 Tax=Paenarthrobacter sp. NPDC089675 TaxID=3364376 RepID=UPI0037F90449
MESQRVRRSRLRFGVMVVAGVIAAAVTGSTGNWVDAPAVAWAVVAFIYVSWIWLAIARMGPDQTKVHATSEDPSRGVTDLLILIANLGSLAAVAAVIVNSHADDTAARLNSAALALGCVALSWMLVQTLFTLRYAELYYSPDPDAGGAAGGISFNQKRPPQYTDFAYLATSLGMTYQVSDTNLENHRIRAEALKHSLLSYLFGTVVLAATINLVIGLAQ